MRDKIDLILEGLSEKRSKAFTFDDFTVKGAKFKLNQDVHYSDFIDFADFTGIKDINKVKKLGFKIDNEYIDFKDKIVIIGRDDPDCKDFHNTPVGIMAGMYVHANSIATVMGETQPHLTTTGRQVSVDMLLILLTAYGYALLPAYLTKYFLTLLRSANTV